ncbi:hypothetical protein [Pseudazoarcus pumilus]|uniref:hypothetical protein n=1 Tax=Pseudazoarcus pumilus TaxID=2067960 RepID=UPI0013DBE199|nr:hypothetical protein [Pseudazoarcus pumilus]
MNLLERLRGPSPRKARALRVRFVERTLSREGMRRDDCRRIARQIIEGLDDGE